MREQGGAETPADGGAVHGQPPGLHEIVVRTVGLADERGRDPVLSGADEDRLRTLEPQRGVVPINVQDLELEQRDLLAVNRDVELIVRLIPEG